MVSDSFLHSWPDAQKRRLLSVALMSLERTLIYVIKGDLLFEESANK